MRYAFLLCVAFFSTFIFASVWLLPADSQTCVDYKERQVAQTCAAEENFYITMDGQCGCLGWGSITAPDICQVAFIQCLDGQEFHSLFTYNTVNNYVEEIYVGCGCFSILPSH